MNLNSTLKRFLILFISISPVTLFAISCGNKVLATYDGGEVTEKKLNEAIEILNLGEQKMQPEMKKELAKAIALWDVLSKRATEEGIDKTDRALMHLDLVKTNLARSVLMDMKQKEIKDSKEMVYKARHILLKVDSSRAIAGPDGKIEQKQLTAEELVALDKSSYERLVSLRADILSGKTKFEDAASQFSQDGSKAKGGDLGYFTKGMMVGAFQVAVEYLAEEIDGIPARVLVNNTAIYTEPNAQSSHKGTQNINSIVFIDEDFKNEKWKKVILDNDTGYIPNTTVQILEDSKKVSYPVRSQFGWHIIEVTESTKVTKKGLAAKLEQSLLNDIPDDKKDDAAEKAAEENAKRTADDFWKRVKSVRSMQWQKKSFSKYGINGDEIALPANWQDQELLLNTELIKIKKADVVKQLTDIVNERHMDLKQVLEEIDDEQALIVREEGRQ
ncbi:MAG: peptidylprolyl isomerase [Leptospirales bacterium]